MLETHFFSKILLPFSLAFIMMGMGLSLTRSDFANIFRHPKALLIGLAAQMLFLPILAFAIATIFNVDTSIKIGLVLIAICPGGAAANMLNYLLNGNLALCVSFTAINSFLTQFTIPVLLGVALRIFNSDPGTSVQLDFWDTLLHLLIITLIPVSLGVLIRAQRPVAAKLMQKPMKVVMPALMALATLAAVFLEKKDSIELTRQDYMTVLPMTLIFNFSALLGGYYVAKLARLDVKTRMTISLEVGLQNTFLAIYIGTALLENTAYAVPAVVYAFFSFFTSAAFGVIVSRQKIPIKSFITGRRHHKKK